VEVGVKGEKVNVDESVRRFWSEKKRNEIGLEVDGGEGEFLKRVKLKKMELERN
jgi:hypothetical protein